MNTGLPLSDIGNLSSALGNSFRQVLWVVKGRTLIIICWSLVSGVLEESAGLTALGCCHLDASLTGNH